MAVADQIIRIGDFWWPLADIHARPVIDRDCAPAIVALLPHIAGRECIVQAGSNIGRYPIALAEHFSKVWTFEPDPVNHDCLIRNISAAPDRHRIHAIEAALGAEPGRCSPVEVEANNCGANRVAFIDTGNVRVLTIDSLGLSACDAIWLDIEGSELLALQGAADTIERFGPTIAVEDKGLQAVFGIAPGALQEWLAERGYVQVANIGRDKVFTRTK